MFGTILDKAASYFDRRALVSSFFPSLVFWGLSVIAFIVFQIDWRSALNSWDKLSGTLQFLLLFAFFVWVTFWSFLTSNFRTAYTRLFEGYWPDKKPFDILLKWRRGYWQRHWSASNKRRTELSDEVGILKTEQDRYEERLKNSSAPQSDEPETTASDADKFQQELNEFLSRLATTLGSYTSPSSTHPSAKDIQKLLHEIQDWRVKLRPWLAEERQKHEGSFAERDKQLRDIHKQLSQQFDQQYAELEKKRISLNRELSLDYPPEPHDIMATRLGNVLKAIELYSSKRYHIDAVLIWPRLQPSLPDALSTTLRDSITSLDLMVTLSAFLLLFGIPFAIWGAVRVATFFPWWLSLVLALIAVFLLVWLSYQNAVQAAFDYGEKIKSAFDLHRWKVLEGFHLQLPTSLEEERKIWDDVCGLLDRGYLPTTRVFSYAQQEQQFLAVPSTVEMPLPAKDLPAYYVIKSEDVTKEQVSKSLIPADAVQKKDDLVGKCTLKPLSALQPVRSALVVDPQRLKGTAAVGISVSLANVLGESLRAGDCIDVVLVPPQTEHELSPQLVFFENLLVMDVKQADKSSKTEHIEGDPSFVIVLAVPVNKKVDFLTMSAKGTVLLSRTLFPTAVAGTSSSS